MDLDTVELWVRRLAGVAAAITLAVALWGFRRAGSKAAGRQTGPASRLLSWPILIVATALYLGLGVVLWRPLPLNLSPAMRLGALIIGVALLSTGLGLYLWSYRTLGEMFGPSSGLGVRLFVGHKLVTHGPYAWVRHPMYLAVIVSFAGGLMIYRTWTMAVFGISMLGLAWRARREDQALAEEFREEWQAYARAVPGWIPKLGRKRDSDL